MELSTIDSKLSAPDCEHMLFRERLLALADSDKSYRLKLICAEAGCGKTVLMSQLYSRDPSIKVWYQLDEYDSDLKVFLSHIARGFSEQFPDFHSYIHERLREFTGTNAEVGPILCGFVNELSDQISKPVDIYLDDYHFVKGSKQVNEAIRFLIQNLHDGCTLTISSRERPDSLSLAKLKAQKEFLELRSSDLRFSIDETTRLIEKFGLPLTEEEITLLNKETDGWAVALSLTSYALRNDGFLTSNGKAWVASNDINDFLQEEIWNHMDKVSQQFFMKCSISDPIDIAIYLHGFGKGNGEIEKRIIRNALDQNLMIVSFDDGKYRMHPLYREFLQARMREELSDEEVRHLHLNYADALISNNREDEAVEHLLEAGKVDQAIRILSQCGDRMIDAGYSEKIASWIDHIQEIDNSSPWIDYFISRIRKFEQDYIEASSAAISCHEQFVKNADSLGQYKSALYLSDLFGIHEDYLKSAHYAEVALKCAKSIEDEAFVLNKIAASVIWQGRIEEGIKLIKHARKLNHETHKPGSGNTLADLAITYLSGNFKKTLRDISNINKKTDWEDDAYGKLRFDHNQITALYLCGKYEAAEKVLHETKKAALRLGDLHEKIMLDETQGLLDFYSGRINLGLDAIEKAEQSFQEMGMDDIFTTLHKGTCYRRSKQHQLALQSHKRGLTLSFERQNLYTTAMSYVNIGADKQYLGMTDCSECELSVAEEMANEFGYRYISTQVNFYRALVMFNLGDLHKASELLAISLSNAASNSHNHFVIQEGKNNIDLLAFGIQNGIESEYLIGIMKQVGVEVMPHLIPLLSTESAGTRFRAIKAIVAAGGVKAAPLLRKMTKDSDQLICDFAKASLKEISSNLITARTDLTPREDEIFILIGKGLSNAEISGKLFISEPTVKTHISRIFRKLGLTRRSQIAAYMNNIST